MPSESCVQNQGQPWHWKGNFGFQFFKTDVQINFNGAGSFQPRTGLDRLKGMVLGERGTHHLSEYA